MVRRESETLTASRLTTGSRMCECVSVASTEAWVSVIDFKARGRAVEATEMTMKTKRFTLFIWLAAICVVGYGCGSSQPARNLRGTGEKTAPTQAEKTTQTTAANGALLPGVVASVDGSSITEATLDHWVAIQASTDYEAVPKGPVPAGVVPDPPAFRACIAYLRSGGSTHEQPSRPRTNAELRAECEANYRTLRAHVLEILISFRWWEAEVKALGIHLSQEKVAAESARFRGEEYHTIANYQRYLRRTGQTLADQYLRMRMDLYTNALREHFTAKGTAAAEHYLRGFSKEWASKTICRPSDVGPNCKEYKGSSEPEARL
jgi:hypothetical protein